MRRGATLSALLHLAVFLVAWLGLPNLFRAEEEIELPLVVEVLPLAEITNAPAKPAEQPTPEPPKPEPPRAQAQPTPPPPPPPPPPPTPPPPAPPPPAPPPPAPLPPAPAPAPTPQRAEPLPPAPAPAPSPPRAEVLPPPPRPRPEPPRPANQRQFDLDNVLKDLTKNRQPQTAAAPPAPPQPPAPQRVAANAPANPNLPLTMGEVDAIRRHIEQYWNPPIGAREAENMRVEVRITLDPDGTVREARTVDQGRLARDEVFRAAAESAERAVRRASPLPISREKYDQLRVINVNFDPRQMLGFRG